MPDLDSTILNRVNEVQGLVVRLEQGVGQVSMQVATVGQQAQETRSELQQLTRDFQKYVLDAQKAVNLQLAQTQIVGVEAQLEHQFGHYKVVRNVATGMLQSFDVGLVSDATVRQTGEQLMMETPRYWLAPVLVAMGAWLADDPERCDRAVRTAYERSASKTSLFMALTLRRQGREEGSLRWLRHYLAALDPSELGREFAMILESVSQGAFGPAGVTLIQQRLDEWRERLLSDESRYTAQVNRWRAEIDQHVAPSASDSYPRLVQVSPQFRELDAALSRAGAHENLIRKYSAMAAEEPTPAERLEDQVDDILDLLVTGYDDEELPLRREHAEHHAVVRHEGDKVAARRSLDTDLLALDKKLDYLTIQSESALAPDKLGVSRATQRMAVSSCHDWFAQAHAAYSRDYRAAIPADVEAVFEGQHTREGVVFQLPRWSGSFNRPMEELERSLASHWDRHVQPFIDKLAYKWGTNLVAPIAVTVVLLVCGVAVHPAIMLIALLVGGGWGLYLWTQAQAAEKRQQDVRNMLHNAKQNSLQQLRGAGAEVVDWSNAFKRADGREPEVRALIADLALAGNAASPYERRVADNGVRTGA
ncbi:hypothetical protein [Paractinoplanes globisporus]|uniref:Uncharacterized protein n=1 Tax=Paractinoplanes globisporus TaxID=113565 RepID=A0ABW6WCM9_9ACTN|nr:hypothetical protein [Actinoplanes globisporus]